MKPCSPQEPRTTNAGTVSPGRAHLNCVSLTRYVRQAYGFHGYGPINLDGHTLKIEGGPPWVETDEFRIDATANASPSAWTFWKGR